MRWHDMKKYVAVYCYSCGTFQFLSDFPDDQHKCYSCLVKEKCRQKRLDVTVRPKHLPLTGDATLWEAHLAGSGFNELPSIKQYGVIRASFDTGEIEIYWPHVDRTSFVFIDEIEFPWEKK